MPAVGSAIARKRAEKALQQSESLLHAVIETSPDPIFLKDRNSRILIANRATCIAMGKPASEIIGKTDLEVYADAEVARKMMANDRLVMESGESQVLEEVIPEPGGQRIFLSMKTPYRDWAGEIVGTVGVARDISQRKRVEEALRQSEEQLRLFIDHAPAALAMFDREMRYICVSQRWIRDYGLVGQEILGRSHYDVFPEISDEWKELHVRCLSGEVLRREEDCFERADGSRQWLRWEIRPWEDLKGEVGGIVMFTEDITKLKIAGEQVNQAKFAAEQANRAKDRFLATLSHELRTPLTPILAAVQLIEQHEDAPPWFREYSEIIKRNIGFEVDLIDDLLDLTRIAHGKVRLSVADMDLHDVIIHAVEAWKERCREKEQELSLRLEAERRHVRGDSSRLQQVFSNLLSNAVKFTGSGGKIVVSTKNSGRNIEAAVSDNGRGLDPRDLGKVFGAFEQSGNPALESPSGLGLGLAISRGLVEMQQGTIEAFSAGPGKGSTFTVILPVAAEAKPRAEGVYEQTETAKTPIKILVVEDNQDTAVLMKRFLVQRGHSVQIANDVQTAIILGKSERFDLLLCDIGLPDGSGIEVVKTLREADAVSKAIAMTGYGMAEDIERSREAGFDTHLTKPVNLEELERLIVGL